MKNISSKINFRKVISVILWAGLFMGLIAALGFVNNKEQTIQGKKTLVDIDYSNGELFIDKEDILKFLKDRNDTVNGRALGKINTNKIEKALRTHSAIADAEVSMSVDGNLHISITQREPVLRVFLPGGESFYLDKKGKFMPLSENYTSRVIIASGNISEPFSGLYNFDYEKTKSTKALADNSIIDDLFELTQFILKDSLMAALTDQIIINEKKEFELIPNVGNQVILIGKCEEIENKIQKLKIFFREGMNHVNGWNQYAAINLKYDGQVICTKKEINQPENKTPQP